MSVELAALVLTHPATPADGLTALVVPGFAQTANTFRLLGEALFGEAFGDKVTRVVVLDLPGHGRSGLPTVLPFGFLSVDDYVTPVGKTV